MAQPTQEKRSYRDTLNLPKTAFPMKANLVQNEPATLKRWAKQGLYQKLRQREHPKGRYTFHDGPPYANGAIHIGHLLNKVLKDMVVRSKTMAGYDCPYIPGWDCHGLPIEHKVMQELGDKAKGMEPYQVRRKCKTYAEKFVKLQSGQMQRLLTLADYDDPYLTMAPAYEAAVLEVFADLVSQGLVYRALKPVHWSIANQTALADAELEYEDREDTSVYVLFEVVNKKYFQTRGVDTSVPLYLMIWTTTPWTLPANLAVAIAPRADYGVYRIKLKGKECFVVVALEVAGKVFAAAGIEPSSYSVVTHFRADDEDGTDEWERFGDITYRHPFIDRTGPVVTADYVTLEDGTGLVHTAPGHGVEDYQTGLREKLDVYCPVQADGTFDSTAPDWLQGKDVWKANELVVKHLHDSQHLFHQETITHSYPHDWRSKTPVIFRATEQWFVSVEQPTKHNQSLRDLGLQQTANDVRFYPEWGRNRMRGMLESRPDWCLSRQRVWGLPIPAFYGPDKDQALLTAASVRAVSANIRKHGSDYWFKATPQELLEGYDPASDPAAPSWFYTKGLDPDYSKLQKANDIFDVWFESGSSWHAVLRQRDQGYPADLYLEGSDQHRGWFQLSLLPALGVTGQPPFRGVLTHGFMVDKDGRKMSKSGGNALEVDTLLKDFGADVCRWWVSSLNSDNDIKVDPEFFRLAGEEYRKVRNTLRFLLSNLDSPRKDGGGEYEFTDTDATSIDAWALGQLNALIQQARNSYEGFQYRKVHEAIFHFCNDTMSAIYLTAVKDRLYCDAPDSPRRRRTQAAIHRITDALIRLVAPILPHTAEEAWLALHGDEAESVHLAVFPDPDATPADAAWDRLMELRDQAMKQIEDARATRDIDNPLDCGLRITPGQDDAEILTRFDLVDLADLCGISRVEISDAHTAQTAFEVLDLRDQPRCERCWKRDGTVKPRSDGGLLSDRDALALSLV